MLNTAQLLATVVENMLTHRNAREESFQAETAGQDGRTLSTESAKAGEIFLQKEEEVDLRQRSRLFHVAKKGPIPSLRLCADWLRR